MGEKILLLAPLVLLVLGCAEGQRYRNYNYYARYYLGRDLYEHGHSISDNLVTCGPHTCGVGAHCIHGSVRPVCACLPGYSGDALTQCVKIECIDNSECRSHQRCVNQHCIDPCAGACGSNANCDVRKHISVCSCPPGYTGDPFSSCRIADPEEACHPSPCGANTKCHVANNQAICTCLPGYRGSPLTGCRHECESDGECSAQHSCRDFKCISPCGDCGVNADCETVSAHRAICKCPRGYFGDPYRICSAECTSDSECPSYKPACVYNACIDPCINACGTNAECHLRGLTPVCSCPRNMTGDPFSYCRPFEARDLCEPNPCGANAKCTPGHDRTGAERPVCTCPTGYIGNALVSCERGECELDSQCSDNLACVGYRCVDPCLGNTQCGSGAVCMARRHIAVCTCQNGRNGDALVNCYDTQSVVATGRYYRYKRDGNYSSQPEPEAPKNPAAPAVVITELKEANTETCHPSPCGANTKCHVANNQAVCTCLPGYRGSPLTGCRHECESHSECPSYKPACVYNACIDPCINACGTNAECHLGGLTPVCSCPRNMTGDPFSYCRPFEAQAPKNPAAPAVVITELKEANTETKVEEKKE